MDVPPSYYLRYSSRFSWCSGYHICLTHRRSPVRSRAKTSNFFVSYFHFIYLFDFQKYAPVFLYLFIFNHFIFVYIWLIMQCSKVKFNRWKKLWIFHKTIFCFFQDPMSGMKMHCPRPDCKWMYFSNQIEDHCARRHGIKTGHNAFKAILSRIFQSLQIVS